MKKERKKKSKTIKYIFSIVKVILILLLLTMFLLYIKANNNFKSVDNSSNNSLDFIELLSTYDNSIEKTNLVTTTSQRFISEYNELKSSTLISLSEEDLSYYSSLSYDERLDFLFNEKYSLEDRIKVFLSSDIDNVGLVYYNLSSDEKISINEDMEFVAASTYKVGLNLLAYYLQSQDLINLNDYVSYTYSDYEEGTGILYLQDYIGSYTVQELLDLSLIHSDNIATNMLGRYLGGHSNIRQELYTLLGVDFTTSSNLITANIEFLILKYIYDNKSNPNFNHMIETLTQTKFNDRLDKYIPTNIVAHKVGNYDYYTHDVGIILADEPYILEIYTYNIYNAEEKIAQISKAIYETY